jgi:hypothetical protein
VGEMKEEGTAGARLRGAARGERPWRGGLQGEAPWGEGGVLSVRSCVEGFSVT